MQIIITDAALKWFTEEMDAEKGNMVRFFVKYGGSSPIQEGFSLGVTIDTPHESGAQTEKNGLIFFVEEEDLWYFDDYNLKVNVNEEIEELAFSYFK